MLGSGNLGLVYLMEERRRLTLEEIDERHPNLIRRCASTRTSAGCWCAQPSTAPLPWAPAAHHHLADGAASRERIRSASFPPTSAQHLLRTDGFEHVADIMVGSFYDPELDEGCAFEELISFHGGHRRPPDAAVHPLPGGLEIADEPIVGAAAVHELLTGWRHQLAGADHPYRTTHRSVAETTIAR